MNTCNVSYCLSWVGNISSWRWNSEWNFSNEHWKNSNSMILSYCVLHWTPYYRKNRLLFNQSSQTPSAHIHLLIWRILISHAQETIKIHFPFECKMINDHFTNRSEKEWRWLKLGVLTVYWLWRWEAFEKEEVCGIQAFGKWQVKIVISDQ